MGFEATFCGYGLKALLCLTYVVVSNILIRFNKILMEKDKFPHALPLSACHMFMSSAWCGLLYLIMPSIFVSLEATEGQRTSLMRWFVPIALLFAANLFGSNQAYWYCSVTFLQFVKESNVMVVFLISCAVGLQRCTRASVFVILWVILGASVSISGEIHFQWVGFVFQMASQLAECSRNVMGECILSGKKVDPLTYTLFLAPICFVVLAVASVCFWDHAVLGDFSRCWHLLLANASVAFLLNLLVACVIKECSAVGFVLCGIIKDIVIVIISSVAFGDRVTEAQVAAFAVTLAGIFFWSLMKTHPAALPVRMVEKMLCSPKPKSEEIPLIPPPTASPQAANLDKKV